MDMVILKTYVICVVLDGVLAPLCGQSFISLMYLAISLSGDSNKMLASDFSIHSQDLTLL